MTVAFVDEHRQEFGVGHFKAPRVNRLWMTDLTYVPTRPGMAYVCFIVDAFSRRASRDR